jgi:hypothetical protein
MAYDLIQVSTLEEWDAYHRIRREELFEAGGRSGLYDATHPDEHKVGNTPLLLKKKWVRSGDNPFRQNQRNHRSDPASGSHQEHAGN